MKITDLRLFCLKALALYVRHAPAHPGRWRLLKRAIRLAPMLRSTLTSRVIRTREGFHLRVDGSSQCGRIVYATGEYEPATMTLMKQLLRPGDTMIDFGANIGYFAVAAARLVKGGGRVVAFEPSPIARTSLEKNVQLNQLHNVTVRDEAIGDSRGDAQLYIGPKHDTGLASLRPLSRSETMRVMQLPFDEVWHPEAPVAMVKIDVEGGELQVLKGMNRTLARHRPHVVVEVTEAYLAQVGASARSLLEFAGSVGYSAFEIRHDCTLRHIVDERDLSACPPQFNALLTARPELLTTAEQSNRRQTRRRVIGGHRSDSSPAPK